MVQKFQDAEKEALQQGDKSFVNINTSDKIIVLADEAHRTQFGGLATTINAALPNAPKIGFTGTPLMKQDKKKSVEVFGTYIHTYKFDEAVADKVVLDLKYEARDVPQQLTSKKAIDAWFDQSELRGGDAWDDGKGNSEGDSDERGRRLWARATAKGDSEGNGEGNSDGRQQWATARETARATATSDGESEGDGQGRREKATARATVTSECESEGDSDR